uniref:Putative ovule protein n=1 Tax=Solanum chacoense TaxID=4108 RepID=A0A0V0HU09_SOLCH
MLDFLQIFLYQTSILTSQPNKACYFPAKQSMLLCRVFSPSRCISSATTQPAAIVIQMCVQISQCRYNCCVLAITICLLDLCYHGNCSNVLKRNSRPVDLPVILKLRFQPY